MSKQSFLTAEKRIDQLLNSKKSKNEIFQGICTILKEEIEHYHWVGFYHLNPESGQLELAEFVGKPTEHVKIPIGKGVCGQVASLNQPMVVQDVSQLDNYISCGLEVQSEIVVPIKKDGKFVSEIDIDSHAAAPFTENDTEFLESLCQKLEKFF